ncbi:MAG: putative inorganic polyphosphate/ATP-NAD kinase [Candidatus Methanofastidiosum methylothiophilum]|uniref:NAD kinase n=1 Tax=Candidatus Methanofastidiosum methylothiophilum TaxID=1705564 RepID=A0A150IS37_9EURY|nr:MAG: putative inorganic polyphosphate/ATP-NAD kinase [Candidatus Methanofastidiosum methylthiophilus]KYC47776.1 MAG: putative inorganic polyphosphate/ATP-NAD kinase [Candidatus Methanofastidiosum methylthiophilus]KYC49404.1 MAG: putative inorganic polyphosphate/ATP-NAD kinase [Candidatus Methanofastidiosum methylthiophilus]
MILRIGIISRTDREKALDTTRKIFDILKDNYEVYFDETLNLYFPDKNYSKESGDVDLLISVGGDGTILKSVRRYRDTPILGVNVGTIGYLNEIPPEEIKSIPRIIQNHSIEERSMISCTINNRTIEALNDIVIRTEVATRVSQVKVEISGQKYIVSGDGVIITTPTGSTAYSYSAGGPIIRPNSQEFGITPICPLYRKASPIVYPDHENVTVTALDRPCTIVTDGFPEGTMNPGDKIEIKKSHLKARFVKK